MRWGGAPRSAPGWSGPSDVPASRAVNSLAPRLLPLLVAAQGLMITRYSIGSRPVRVLPSGRFLFAVAGHYGGPSGGTALERSVCRPSLPCGAATGCHGMTAARVPSLYDSHSGCQLSF